MQQEEFKKAALASLLPIKEAIGVKRIALDLYEIYGMGKGLETFQRHISACFDAKRPEFFHFCDVVNMCLLYDIFDPLYFLCSVTGHAKPEPIDCDVAAELEKVSKVIPLLQRQLEAHEKKRLELLATRGGEPIQAARFSVEAH